MVRADRLCISILILGFALIIPSVNFIKFIDELCALLFGSVALLDCIVNNNWNRYKLLWIVIGIITLYAVYSLNLPYNTPWFIFKDIIIELKPFIPFLVLFAIGPQLNDREKTLIKKIALFNASAMTIALFCGSEITKMIVFHVTYAGGIIFVSMLLYLYCSLNEDGIPSKKDILTTVLFLTFGLACTRSKYYGIYVLSLFLLYVYKPGVFKNVTPKHFISFLALIAIVILVAWNKISYYFLTGNSESFDPTVIETYARPVLYATGALILIDHFPFGTGLASFASYTSGENYSGVYYEYGIDKVYGLSPQTGDFICDAFLPSLAQFGVVGLILFVYFWIYTYNYLRFLIRQNPVHYKYLFIIATLILCFILIESTGGTTFTQSIGFIAMSLFGIICGFSRKTQVDNFTSLSNSATPVISLRKI